MQFLSLKFKLLLSCIFTSVVLTLVLSVFETSNDHNEYIKDVNQEFSNIEAVHREYLTKRMWAMDYDSLIAFANEKVSELKIDNFRITDPRGTDIVHAGKPLIKNSSVHQFDLSYYYKNKTVTIGKVFIGSNIPSYTEWFLSRWHDLLLVNGFLVLVIFFISYSLFYKQVLARLTAIKAFSETDVFSSSQDNKLSTVNGSIPDEITLLSNILVERRKHIREEYQRRVEVEKELIDKNTALSVEVKERQRAELALRASKDKYQLLVDSQTDLLIKIDLEGRFEFVSQSYCKMVGQPEDVLVNKNSMTFVHPDDQLRTEQEIQKILLPPHTAYLEQRVDTIEGWRWLAWAGAAVFDKQQNIIAIIGTGRDITEQKNAELELEKSQAEFQAIFSSITDALVFVNTDREILMINPAFTKIFGYSFEEIKNKKTKFLYTNKTSYEQVAEKIYNETSGCSKSIYENEYLKKDGSVFIAETLGVPVKNAKDQLLGFVGIMRDITDRKKEEKEKELLENRLRQTYKMEAIGTLAGGIAHDFNNILTVLLGYAEMSKEDSPSGSTVTQYIDQVIKAGTRAENLVKQILSFGRQQDSERISFMPASRVRETLKMLRPTIPSTIEIIDDIDPHTRSIFADPSQFEQILMNLCTNAYQVLEKTGGKINVSLQEISLKEEDLLHEPDVKAGSFVKLSVSDTGRGISTEIMEKIFDPFFTTKEVGEGTGLGLSIVHGIVKNYGGLTTLESEIDEGTTFHVFLPVDLNVSTIEVDILAATPSPMGEERVLLVDDEEELSEMGELMLERLGYTVTVSNSSFEALEIFQNQPDQFDLIITDQTMPEMAGADMAAMMLQIRPDIPIILCTGYSSIMSKEKAISMGIREYMLKPLSRKNLAVLIRKVLDT